MDWADRIAQDIVDEPGIIQVFHHGGYCRKCKMPVSGAAVDLSKLKNKIAEAMREVKEVNR